MVIKVDVNVWMLVEAVFVLDTEEVGLVKVGWMMAESKVKVLKWWTARVF